MIDANRSRRAVTLSFRSQPGQTAREHRAKIEWAGVEAGAKIYVHLGEKSPKDVRADGMSAARQLPAPCPCEPARVVPVSEPLKQSASD
jgi:hypothetical protein